MKALVAVSVAVLAGCSAAPAAPSRPAAASAAPSAPPPPRASVSASASASAGPAWATAPLLSLPQGTFALPGDIPPTKRDVLWDDSSCGVVSMSAAGEAAFLLCNRQGEVLRVGADKETRVIYRNEVPLTMQVAAGDQLFVAQAGVNNGVLLSVPQAGGPFRVMTRGIDGPHSLAADGQVAFVASHQRLLRITRSGDERVVARTTNIVTTSYARAGEVAFVDVLPATSGAPFRHVVLRVRGTGEPELVAAFAESVDRLTGDDRALYVHLSPRHEIVRLPRTGEPTVVTRTFGVAAGPVTDGTHLYWVDLPNGTPAVLRAKTSGGAAEVIARLEPTDSVQQLALTDRHVLLLVVGSTGQLLRVAK